MNVADALVPPGGFESSAEKTCIGQGILHDTAVTREAKVDEIVVLRNDLRTWAREVQGVRFFSPTEVMKLEDKVLGELRFIPPDNPANTSVDQTEFVTRDVDGFYARKFEIPASVSYCMLECGTRTTKFRTTKRATLSNRPITAPKKY